jgi:hypothetical protein
MQLQTDGGVQTLNLLDSWSNAVHSDEGQHLSGTGPGSHRSCG